LPKNLYSRAFGNAKDTPILFLHGGPGYNCAGFEVSTAQELANNGFYILFMIDAEKVARHANAKFTRKLLMILMVSLKNYNLEKVNP
jgi:proline iminopeptidase